SVRPASAEMPRIVKHGVVSPLLSRTRDRGRAPRADRHRVVVGLALRQREALEAFLADVQDPGSPRYHQFLTQDEFNALYALGPQDIAHLCNDGPTYDGSGETIVIAGAYRWDDGDNTAFAAEWGLPALPAGSGQVCTGPAASAACQFSAQNSIEVALDVEYAHGVAPAARILNYMAKSTALVDFTAAYNRIVTDNPGHVVTTS